MLKSDPQDTGVRCLWAIAQLSREQVARSDGGVGISGRVLSASRIRTRAGHDSTPTWQPVRGQTLAQPIGVGGWTVAERRARWRERVWCSPVLSMNDSDEDRRAPPRGQSLDRNCGGPHTTTACLGTRMNRVGRNKLAQFRRLFAGVSEVVRRSCRNCESCSGLQTEANGFGRTRLKNPQFLEFCEVCSSHSHCSWCGNRKWTGCRDADHAR